MGERLVPPAEYNKSIKELFIFHRIEIKHPLLVREEVAKRLAVVANNLPEDFRLQIDSGYRSRASQEKIWAYRLKQFKGNYKRTKSLVFDPQTGVPPHTTGGAVDISLIDINTNREVNLSDPLPKFYMEPQLHSPKISPKSQELRILINKLMLEQRFAPHPREYWHFSYGDKMWADFYRKKLIYDEIQSGDVIKFNPLLILLFRSLLFGFRLRNKLFKIETNY